MKNLYCYIDEAGQDTKSEFFIVVVAVSDEDQDLFRERSFQFKFVDRWEAVLD